MCSFALLTTSTYTDVQESIVPTVAVGIEVDSEEDDLADLFGEEHTDLDSLPQSSFEEIKKNSPGIIAYARVAINYILTRIHSLV